MWDVSIFAAVGLLAGAASRLCYQDKKFINVAGTMLLGMTGGIAWGSYFLGHLERERRWRTLVRSPFDVTVRRGFRAGTLALGFLHSRQLDAHSSSCRLSLTLPQWMTRSNESAMHKEKTWTVSKANLRQEVYFGLFFGLRTKSTGFIQICSYNDIGLRCSNLTPKTELVLTSSDD